MKALITGADGFAGGWLVRALLEANHEITGICRRGAAPSPVLSPAERARVTWREMELPEADSIAQATAGEWDVVVHLAAISSGAEARRQPAMAWDVNVLGSMRVAESLGGKPIFLFVSTGEVYGKGEGKPHAEDDVVAPVSPYAASKAAAEAAVTAVSRESGLRVIIARPFPHTGPGQDARFVVPAFARRLLEARRTGAATIAVGNLDPVRDLLDVRDVAAAYALLLARGVPGEIYNVASGTGYALSEVLNRLIQLMGLRVEPSFDPALAHSTDITHLVGNPSRLRSTTGWTPTFALDRTLQDLLDAQTH